jgi:hypothetical protein
MHDSLRRCRAGPTRQHADRQRPPNRLPTRLAAARQDAAHQPAHQEGRAAGVSFATRHARPAHPSTCNSPTQDDPCAKMQYSRYTWSTPTCIHQGRILH